MVVGAEAERPESDLQVEVELTVLLGGWDHVVVGVVEEPLHLGAAVRGVPLDRAEVRAHVSAGEELRVVDGEGRGVGIPMARVVVTARRSVFCRSGAAAFDVQQLPAGEVVELRELIHNPRASPEGARVPLV